MYFSLSRSTHIGDPVLVTKNAGLTPPPEAPAADTTRMRASALYGRLHVTFAGVFTHGFVKNEKKLLSSQYVLAV